MRHTMLALWAVVSTTLFAAAAPAQSSGAIFTTTRQGDAVNGNLFNTKNAVYLSGGPGPNSPCSSAGLTDGTYYFQVTNPSGSVLLSSDPISNRILVVSGGIVTAHLGSHRLGSAPCGAASVQLAPFDDTPSNGGEYKVWMTPVAQYSTAGEGFFGFLSKYSKTDNFKVKSGRAIEQCLIQGYKFYDFTGDGLWEPIAYPQETPIPGWRIEIYRDGQLDDYTFTDDLGRYEFLRDLDGTTYEIREVAPGFGFVPAVDARWVNATPTSGQVTANAAIVDGPTFGNFYLELAVGVGRTKGFWHNQNGRDLLENCDPIWRDALGTDAMPVCLRRPISTLDPTISIFTVPQPPASFDYAFTQFADWIVGDPALGHAGFILSSQVAATILSNTCGYMQGIVYVDRRQDSVLVSLDQMLTDVGGLLCDPCAGLTGPQDPCQDLRNAMLACLNEFASINETEDPDKPQVIYMPKSEYESFGSPY